MREVYKNTFVGDVSDCREGVGEWSIIHACKYPCHRNAVGYKKKISPTHLNYLVLRQGQNLYLNIIDPDEPLFMKPLFIETLCFCNDYSQSDRKLLFHCNKGDSRAPSLALLHLSKNLNIINDSSYEAAAIEYKKLDPFYKPGLGIQTYLGQHWNELKT